MVQVVNQAGYRPNYIGEAVGSGLGEALAQNLPDPQMQQQGRQQKGALEDFKSQLDPSDTMADISYKWAQSFAGIPGGGELAKTVLPQFQMQGAMNQGGGQQKQQQFNANPAMGVEGSAGMGVNPTGESLQGMVPPSGGSSSLQGMVPAPGQGQGQQMGGGGQGQGFDPQLIMTAKILGTTPEKLLELSSNLPQERIATEMQQQQMQRNENLADFASKRLFEATPEGNPKVDADELNQFMRTGQKYQNLSPEDWFRKTRVDFNKYQNAKKGFESANIPGLVSGIFKGSGNREQALKRLEGLAKPFMELGDEDFVRSKLTELGLSTTESNMVMRPMDRSGIKDYNKLPKTPYGPVNNYLMESAFTTKTKPTYEEMQGSKPEMLDKMTDKYADFLKDNVTNKVSLSGLREKMYRENGIDYRQYLDAVNRAVDDGLQLTAEQQGEMSELTTAPKDSLAYIFQDYGNIIDYMTGKK